jgi:hypothetical protein
MSIAGEGTHNLSCTATDGAGNTSGPTTKTVKIDTVFPTINVTFTPVKNADGWNNSTSVVVSYSCSDATSGIDTTYSSPPNISGCPASDTATQQGLTQFNGRIARDLAGNLTTVNPSVSIDRDAPTINQGTIHGTAGNNGWYTTDVTVDFTAFDSLSGLKNSADASFSLAASGEGSTVSTGSRVVSDKADNASTAGPLSFKIDKHAPTISCGLADGNWHGSNVSIGCTASDSLSGLANPSDASFSLSTNVAPGSYDANASTGTYQVCDAAGNCATAGPIAGNKIDRQAPTFSCQTPDSDWHASNVTLHCTAQDGGSGLNGSSPASFDLSTTVANGSEDPNASTGSQGLTDAVGNSTTAGPYSGIKVDRKAPTFSCPAADSAWHGSDVTLNCTAQDGGSGLDGSSPASFGLSTSVPSGTETSNASTGTQALTDGVGNSTTAGPISGNKVDKKKPVVSCGGPDGAWHAADVDITCTATDGGSGLANPADASFALSTSVPANTEDANASTGSHVVADAVSNSNTAGPIAGNKVDKKAPEVNCASTDSIWHAGNVSFSCTATDGGSGVVAPATVSLSTAVASGDETAFAFTGTYDFFDVAGNMTQAGPVGPSQVDRKAPQITCGSSDGLWHAGDITIHCTATDGGSGIPVPADQSFDLSTNAPANTENANVSTDSRSVADAVGNTAVAGPVSGNQIDKKAPAVACGSADGSWHATDVSIACLASDAGSGLLNAGDANFSLSTNVPADTDDSNASTGSRTVKDNVLNATVAGPIAGNKVDKRKPVITCDPPAVNWSGSDVSIHCTATDGTGSGLAVPADASFYLTTNVPAGTETANASTGTHQVCDAVNNCDTAGPISGNKVDKKAPQQSSCDSPDGLWHGTDVTLKCHYTDGGSGPATQDVSLMTNVAAGSETSNAAASAGGTQACDAVGNCATSPANISGNKIDKKAPQQSSCDSPDGLWHASDVTLKCHYTDGGSGPATQDVSLTTSVPSGTETSAAVASAGTNKACDAVLNCAASPADIGGNKVDKKAPQQSSCDSPDGLWHASDVTLKCHYTDGGSGPATQDVSLTTSVANGTETANAAASAGGVKACDAVLNCAASPADISGNKVDKKGPSITITTPASAGNYTLAQSVAASYGCTDGGSGPSTCVGTVANGSNIDTATVGSKTFTVNATDALGNPSTLQYTYSVKYAASGTCNGDAGHVILQPINTDGTSVFKKGSTVPAKFRVCDAYGVSIGDPGVVASFKLIQIINGIEVTTVNEAVDSTTPDTAFRWDPTAQQWIFNINTKNLTANKTYMYLITLNDGPPGGGSTIPFQFGLK